MSINLLFVDDEPKLQAVISQLFRREIRDGQYNIWFALNGVEAIEVLQAHPEIDIVLTDLNMPQMSGLALLAKLEELKSTLNPVLTAVVISAYGDMENIRKAMNTGAFDFLTKPLDFEDLKLTISKAAEHVSRLKSALERERQAQEALRQINEELERRVEARTAELRKSNAELNAFAHTVAHDLKNPLGVIAGYVDYAVDFFNELEMEELLETIKYMQQYTYKVTNIVEELMLLSGVRKLDVPRRPIDMGSVVEQAKKRLAPMIAEHNAQINLPESWPVANGYAPWIEEVWVNYISNGLKYGGTPPHLELGGEALADGMVRFWIKDNGPGVDPADQERLFTEFTRLDERRADGHGLGLSIVRRIVEKLDGEVGVDSHNGDGSTFYFTLPAPAPEEES